LGGLVGEKEDRDEWLESKIVTWFDIIKQLSMVAGPYPQSSYAGMQKSVQAEWTFVQRVVWDMGDKFDTIGEAMHRSFVSSLMKETKSENDPLHRQAALPVKSAGLVRYPGQSILSIYISTYISTISTAGLANI
jgi:hypothetical protein